MAVVVSSARGGGDGCSAKVLCNLICGDRPVGQFRMVFVEAVCQCGQTGVLLPRSENN